MKKTYQFSSNSYKLIFFITDITRIVAVVKESLESSDTTTNRLNSGQLGG